MKIENREPRPYGVRFLSHIQMQMFNQNNYGFCTTSNWFYYDFMRCRLCSCLLISSPRLGIYKHLTVNGRTFFFFNLVCLRLHECLHCVTAIVLWIYYSHKIRWILIFDILQSPIFYHFFPLCNKKWLLPTWAWRSGGRLTPNCSKFKNKCKQQIKLSIH